MSNYKELQKEIDVTNVKISFQNDCLEDESCPLRKTLYTLLVKSLKGQLEKLETKKSAFINLTKTTKNNV